MELLQLRYFLELAKSEHLTKTAEKLMISPPSLSSTIRKLEDELGVQLFDRKAQRIYLNENGKKYYKYVEDALKLLEDGKEAISPKEKTELNIAMTSQLIYSGVLYQYEQEHPNIVVHSSVIPVEALNQTSIMDKYDFYCGIIEDIDVNYFAYKQIHDHEHPVILISKNNPLSKRQTLKLNELSNCSFVSILPENTSAHNYMMRIFNQEHFQPKKIYYGGYLLRMKMVSENKAVAISTQVGASVNSIPLESIKIIPLEGKLPTRTQAICWNKSKQLTEVEKQFISFVEIYFKNVHTAN